MHPKGWQACKLAGLNEGAGRRGRRGNVRGPTACVGQWRADRLCGSVEGRPLVWVGGGLCRESAFLTCWSNLLVLLQPCTCGLVVACILDPTNHSCSICTLCRSSTTKMPTHTHARTPHLTPRSRAGGAPRRQRAAQPAAVAH
eukprot:350521-Chlamydomonas_euryale.AAC.7